MKVRIVSVLTATVICSALGYAALQTLSQHPSIESRPAPTREKSLAAGEKMRAVNQPSIACPEATDFEQALRIASIGMTPGEYEAFMANHGCVELSAGQRVVVSLEYRTVLNPRGSYVYLSHIRLEHGGAWLYSPSETVETPSTIAKRDSERLALCEKAMGEAYSRLCR